MIEKWNQWKNSWEWIMSVATRKGWWTYPLSINPTITVDELEALEKRLGVKYPKEFRHVLTHFGAAVKMGWSIDLSTPQEVFCFASLNNAYISWGGGGKIAGFETCDKTPYLWDFNRLEELYHIWRDWILNCYNDPVDPYDCHYHNKLPFIEICNGDLIVFDTEGRVVFLCHDGDVDFHGVRLADDFCEFISIWSRLGCAGPEIEDLKIFYDFSEKRLAASGERFDAWVEWLNG